MDKKKRRKKWLIVLGSVWLFFYVIIWLGGKTPNPQPDGRATSQNAAENQAREADARAKAEVDEYIAAGRRQEQAAKREQAAQRHKADEEAAFWKNKENKEGSEAAAWSRDHPVDPVVVNVYDSPLPHDSSPLESAPPPSSDNGDQEKQKQANDLCRAHKQTLYVQLRSLKDRRESLISNLGNLSYDVRHKEEDALDLQISAQEREWRATRCD